MLSKLRMLNRVGNTMVQKQRVFMPVTQRFILQDLGLDSNSLAVRETSGSGAVDLWKAHSAKNELVLKTDDEVENYVLSITKDYFLCTKKQKVSLDSAFADHGLDSLDVVELVIRVEDELGYVIDAENLEKFKKPRHFVNFIKHMEAYKEEFGKAPHEGNKADMSMDALFPGLPKMGH